MTFTARYRILCTIAIFLCESCHHQPKVVEMPAKAVQAAASASSGPLYCQRYGWPAQDPANLVLYAVSLHHAGSPVHIPTYSESQYVATNFYNLFEAHATSPGTIGPIGTVVTDPADLIIVLPASPWNYDVANGIFDTGKVFHDQLQSLLGVPLGYYNTTGANLNCDNNSSVILGSNWALSYGVTKVTYPTSIMGNFSCDGSNGTYEGKDFGDFGISGHGIKFHALAVQTDAFGKMTPKPGVTVNSAQVAYAVNYGSTIVSPPGFEPAIIAGDFNHTGWPNDKDLQSNTIDLGYDLNCENWSSGLDSFPDSDVIDIVQIDTHATRLLSVAFPFGQTGPASNPTTNHIHIDPLDHDVVGVLMNIQQYYHAQCPCLSPPCLQKIASGTAGTTNLAANDESLFWVEGDGRVGTVSKCGGTVTGVAYDQNAYAVAATNSTVYWTSRGIVSASVRGSATPTTLSTTSYAYGIALQSGNVYCLSNRQAPAGALVSVPQAGGATTTVSGFDYPEYLAAGDGRLFVLTSPNAFPGSVATVGSNGSIVNLVTGVYGGAVAAANGMVYWTDYVHKTINAVPESGGTNQVLATGQSAPFAIAADAFNVYWGGGGSILKQPIGGGPTTTLWTSTDSNDSIEGVVVDDDSVFWITAGIWSVNDDAWSVYKLTPK